MHNKQTGRQTDKHMHKCTDKRVAGVREREGGAEVGEGQRGRGAEGQRVRGGEEERKRGSEGETERGREGERCNGKCFESWSAGQRF
jgi:hypothetical protein